MKLGRVLSGYRYAERMQQKDLAAEIGIAASTLNRFELGNAVPNGELGAILAWLLKNDGDGKITMPHEEPSDEPPW